jgi:hypothetical protein
MAGRVGTAIDRLWTMNFGPLPMLAGRFLSLCHAATRRLAQSHELLWFVAAGTYTLIGFLDESKHPSIIYVDQRLGTGRK